MHLVLVCDELKCSESACDRVLVSPLTTGVDIMDSLYFFNKMFKLKGSCINFIVLMNRKEDIWKNIIDYHSRKNKRVVRRPQKFLHS